MSPFGAGAAGVLSDCSGRPDWYATPIVPELSRMPSPSRHGSAGRGADSRRDGVDGALDPNAQETQEGRSRHAPRTRSRALESRGRTMRVSTVASPIREGLTDYREDYTLSAFSWMGRIFGVESQRPGSSGGLLLIGRCGLEHSEASSEQ